MLSKIWWTLWKSGLIALALAAALSLAAAESANITDGLSTAELTKSHDTDASFTEASCVLITLSEDGAETTDPNAVTVSDGVVTVRARGDYILRGTWNGAVAVDEPTDGRVRLILAGVTVTSPEGPAIRSLSEGKLVLTLAEDTENTLTDSTAMTLTGGAEEDTLAAAVWAANDLSVNGTGALLVNGRAKHGIQSRSDLILAGGGITVTAAKDGIRGRNSVLILDGTVTVTSGGDGVTSTRENKPDKGWVLMTGGTLRVTAGEGADPDGEASAKGIKAAADLGIRGGTVTVDSADDALHARHIAITGGSLTLSTGDDAIHADEVLAIAGGETDIRTSHEALEAREIALSGGRVLAEAAARAVDCGGAFTVTGGTLLAAGPDAAAESIPEAEGQAVLLIAGGGSGEVTVRGADGTVLQSWTPGGTYGCLLITAPSLQPGDAVSVLAGEETLWSGTAGAVPTMPEDD